MSRLDIDNAIREGTEKVETVLPSHAMPYAVLYAAKAIALAIYGLRR